MFDPGLASAIAFIRERNSFRKELTIEAEAVERKIDVALIVFPYRL